jgi:hypothetical protein
MAGERRDRARDDDAPVAGRRFGPPRWLILLFAAALVGGGALTAKYEADRWVRRQAAARLAEALPKLEKLAGARLTTGDAQFGLDGSVALHDVVIAETSGAAPFVTCDKLEIHYSLDLKNKTATVDEIRLRRPRLTFQMAANGSIAWPEPLARLFSRGKDKSAKTDDPLSLSHGRVRVADVITVRFYDGEATVTDAGRFVAGPLFRIGQAHGAARFDAPTREVTVAGQAKELAGGGKFDFTLAAESARAKVTFACRDLPLTSLAPCAPPLVKLTSDARLDSETAVTVDKTGRAWRIETNSRVAGVTLANPRLGPAEIHNVAGALRGELQFDPAEKTIRAPELEIRLGEAPFFLRDLTLRAWGKAPFLLQTGVGAHALQLQALLDGLPADLIPILKGLKVEGAANLRAALILDTAAPSRSNLDVDGEVTDFRVVSAPARCDVRQINRLDFTHLARKHGELQATIVVGPANRDFVPLADLGPYIVGAVLTCEDGSFFRHNGFMLRHINDSLRRDLHEKRFARGASTVSMQLVKNVFLSEEKTLSRKLQEMLLTWWLEKEVKKDRILETYLNIIEWGPKIYGIGPAAHHYFHCSPRSVTPIQAAFLGSIIANPVRYHYMKQKGEISDGWRTTLAFVMQKMVERGTIEQAQYDEAAAENFDVSFEPPPDADDDVAAPKKPAAWPDGERQNASTPRPLPPDRGR